MSDTIDDLTDGRRARRAGNRRRMLAVGLKIIQRSGSYRVNPKDITDGADMHPRSFHACFGGLDGFYEALITEHGATLYDMMRTDMREKDKSLVRLVMMGK